MEIFGRRRRTTGSDRKSIMNGMLGIPELQSFLVVINTTAYHLGRYALNVSAPIDPYYWVLPSGAPIDRSKMMVVLNNLKGVYIKASYGVDKDGQARLGSFRHLNYLSRYNNSISNQKIRQSFSVDNLHLWLLVICVAISFF